MLTFTGTGKIITIRQVKNLNAIIENDHRSLFQTAVILDDGFHGALFGRPHVGWDRYGAHDPQEPLRK